MLRNWPKKENELHLQMWCDSDNGDISKPEKFASGFNNLIHLFLQP
jgi:hypothetical protein